MSGSLVIAGLGPGDEALITPEVTAALSVATDVVGYAAYIARVAPRANVKLHASDNREELARACEALAMAEAGRHVVVVSSGDPGVFAMASAVFEALDAGPPAWRDLDIRVLPGVTAMLAAAARVGAPLGHDCCAINLSDNLKPWSIIERRLRLAVEADLVIALYNPRSKGRPEGFAHALDVLRGACADNRPVILRARRLHPGGGHPDPRASGGPARHGRHAHRRHPRLEPHPPHPARSRRALRLHAKIGRGMIEPGKHLRDLDGLAARRRLWPVDHQHRQAQRPGGVELRLGAGPAGVARHDDVDAMRKQERAVAVGVEGPAREHHMAARQRRRRIGGINEPQQIPVRSLRRERLQPLPAQGQKDTAGRAGERGGGGLRVGRPASNGRRPARARAVGPAR